MIAQIEKWKEGWQGISIGITNSEIEQLIESLKNIKKDNDQHFHISSDCIGEPGLGGIEIYVKSSDEIDNMYLSSLAIEPNKDT